MRAAPDTARAGDTAPPRRSPSDRCIVRVLAAACALLCASCPPAEPERNDPGDRQAYHSWASLGEQPPANGRLPEAEALLAAGDRPWAGVVSHHLLADRLIDSWFAKLAQARSVRRFFILSPAHGHNALGEFAVAERHWRGARSLVRIDAPASGRVALALGAMQDHDAFAYEHGISTLVPYIERHFPEAELVAICYRGEPPVSLPMADRLADALAPWFRGTAGEENFLLISADFAHHGTVEGTMLKDKRTRRFFDNPGMGTWDLAGCDNRPGIYAVASLGGTSQRSVVLYHSDSYRLSGQAEDDITSYFFAWFIKAPEKGS